MYNWGDPRRNSSLSMKMMEKTEAARKERLSKVKATVSNHLHPAVEKKLPKKQEKVSAAELYMSTLESNQESTYLMDESPFSVHNVVENDSIFHPESKIEAFKGMKKPIQSKHGREKMIKEEFDENPTWLSRMQKARGKSEEKLPSIQQKPSSKTNLLPSTRSDPDLSYRRDSSQYHQDALELFEAPSKQDIQQRSDSAPAGTNSTALSQSAVPLLDFKPLSREYKSDKKLEPSIDEKPNKVDKNSKSKKTANSLKSRGTSLAQLKDEHRAALELLQELGGAYPAEDKSLDESPLSSRFGAKLRSTIEDGRALNTSNVQKLSISELMNGIRMR
ncbi:hypothetical protein THRCLA_05254, partial [Thraustotheca clavata]